MKKLRNCRYSILDFLKLVKQIQSSQSFRKDKSNQFTIMNSHLIEKAYEILDEIDLENSEVIKEELSDILLKVAYHYDDDFFLDDALGRACKKIVSKYPHTVSSKDEISDEKCKVYNIRDRKNYNLKNVRNAYKVLPTLARTSKIQERAAQAGYDFFSIKDAINEAFEKLHYLEDLILDGNQDCFKREIGDLLFFIIEISRLLGINAERSLYHACERFKNEFLFKLSLENRDEV